MVSEIQRERSDAFHWAQSLHPHPREGIKKGSRPKHLELWRKLRDAKNVVDAYKISHEITIWWKAGNCYPKKLRFLEGWLAWWVVRWTQWGNYICLVSHTSSLHYGILPLYWCLLEYTFDFIGELLLAPALAINSTSKDEYINPSFGIQLLLAPALAIMSLF